MLDNEVTLETSQVVISSLKLIHPLNMLPRLVIPERFQLDILFIVVIEVQFANILVVLLIPLKSYVSVTPVNTKLLHPLNDAD